MCANVSEGDATSIIRSKNFKLLYGISTSKSTICIHTAVQTSDLTNIVLLLWTI
jgi:hypothetical protein